MARFRSSNKPLRTFKPQLRSVPKGTFSFVIDRWADDGRGIAIHNGKTVFVKEALPGEEIKARYISSHKSFDEAECIALPVSKITYTNNFIIYPNPVKEQFIIETNKHIETIKLHTISGRLLKSFKRQKSYSVLGLPHGIYYLNILWKEGFFIQKLIID